MSVIQKKLGPFPILLDAVYCTFFFYVKFMAQEKVNLDLKIALVRIDLSVS